MKAETGQRIIKGFDERIERLGNLAQTYGIELREEFNDIARHVPPSEILEEIKDPIAQGILKFLSDLANAKSNGTHEATARPTMQEVVKEADHFREQQSAAKSSVTETKKLQGHYELRVVMVGLLRNRHPRGKITTRNVIAELREQGYQFTPAYVSKILQDLKGVGALQQTGTGKGQKVVYEYVISSRNALVRAQGDSPVLSHR